MERISGCPVVKILPGNARDIGSIPGGGTKIPLTMEQLSPCDTIREKPNSCNERPHMPQWRPCVPPLRPNTAKIKIFFKSSIDIWLKKIKERKKWGEKFNRWLKGHQVPISGIWTVTLCGKTVFTDVGELMIFRYGDYPGLSKWDLKVITCILIRGTLRSVWYTDYEKAVWPGGRRWSDTAMSQGMLAAARVWKGFSSSGGGLWVGGAVVRPCWHLDSARDFRLLGSRAVRQ